MSACALKPLNAMDAMQAALAQALATRTAAVHCGPIVTASATTQTEQLLVTDFQLAMHVLKIAEAVFAYRYMPQSAVCSSRMPLKLRIISTNETTRTIRQVRYGRNTRICKLKDVPLCGWGPLYAFISCYFQPVYEGLWSMSLSKSSRPIAIVKRP